MEKYKETYVGDKILFLEKEGLESISGNIYPTWRYILLNLPEDDEDNDIINILNQSIMFDYNIKRHGNVFIIWNYCYNCALISNGIIPEYKQLLSYQTFQNKYIISTNCHEICAIVGTVKKGWNKNSSEYGRVDGIKNYIVDRLKRV